MLQQGKTFFKVSVAFIAGESELCFVSAFSCDKKAALQQQEEARPRNTIRLDFLLSLRFFVIYYTAHFDNKVHQVHLYLVVSTIFRSPHCHKQHSRGPLQQVSSRV